MRALCCTLALLASITAAAAESSGELRLHLDPVSASTAGPLAQAHAASPGIAALPGSTRVAEFEWRHTQRLGASGLAAGLNLLARHEAGRDGPGRDEGRANELYLAGEHGAWGWSAGRKVVGWDVGHGFRPNDLVQQEVRRTLLGATPEGRALLQIEHFGSETATTLVWVHPQRLNQADGASRGGEESALAGRWYRRGGALDLHLFGRIGAHTRGSAGAAFAWVAGDELELHASARLLERHDGWRLDPTAGLFPVATNPWQVATLGTTSQWLLGLNWTGAQRQSLLVEAWHDGGAPPDTLWDAWARRNRSLAATPAPAAERAGNLAWQAEPLAGPGLRRDNLFVRLAWQPEPWQFSVDALLHPADRGHILTAALQWQGDRLRLTASWRVYRGPADSVVAQLPVRSSALLLAAYAF